MTIYFLVFLFLLLVSVCLPYGKVIPRHSDFRALDRNNESNWNYKTVLVLILIGFVAGFRDYSMGTDYAGYIEFYEYILHHDIFMPGPLIGVESGWNYGNLWSAQMGIPIELFFGIVAIITWYFFIKGSYKYQYLLPLMFFFAFTPGFFILDL